MIRYRISGLISYPGFLTPFHIKKIQKSGDDIKWIKDRLPNLGLITTTDEILIPGTYKDISPKALVSIESCIITFTGKITYTITLDPGDLLILKFKALNYSFQITAPTYCLK